MSLIIRSVLFPFLLTGLAGGLCAQTLSDLGPTAPNPETNDIYQLSTQGDQTWPDGINYFSNNNPPAGQTFTTGTNAVKLATVAIQTAGLNNGGGYGTPATTPTYYLRIYSISGSMATLLISFSAANPGFTDGDWLKWSGINVPLQANHTYAFTFGIQPSGGGYAALAVATNAYAGGEIVTIPINGGTITTGGSHTFDAVFDLGFRAGPTNIPASMPFPIPTYGWNLGNTLEATWGVPNWTAAPFFTAANAGFNAVRIPCAWDFNSTTNISGGVTNYMIKPAFMAQVKQAVDDAIAAGMYVVINDHWDDGWLENNIGTNVNPTINAKMKSYWTQIATAFAGYDNHLMFAAANEPNVNNTAEEVTLMYYYQTFVNAVRGAGGNNTNRWLVLQSVSDPTWLNALPTDTVSHRIMVEYHQYTPSLFTIIHTDQSWGNAIYFWGPAYHYSGDPTRNATWGEEGDIDSFFQQLADLYVSKGIPVMIGEFGAYSTPSLTGTEATWNSDSVDYWNKYVAESARGHGLSPFYWSTVNSPWDWTSGAIYDTQIVSELTGGAAPPPPNGASYAPSGLTTTGGNGQVTLSWTAGSGATSYNLYRAGQSGSESSISPVVTGLTGTNYTDGSLGSGTTYYYQVVAVNGSGLSGFSPEAHATTSGVIADPAQFNFETDSQGWTGGGGIVSGVATSAAQHYAGNQSLAVNFNGSAAGTASPSVGNVAIAAGTTITFHVWIPSSANITAIQPYVQDHNWTWTGNYTVSGNLTANAWNTITLTVPANAVSPMQSLGVQFFTSAGWTGTCYIDSVSYTTPVPDFNLVANPSSLTLNGGANGTSTITVTPTDGLNACYTLSVSNLPSGVSALFTNNPITGGASLLTLTASNSVVSGTTNVTVIATAGLISHTETIALTLNSVTPPNTPPTLAPIANQTVNVGQTVAFTAGATDTDQPPQTLTFALLAGATNATLNTSSGAFSFRPLVTQADSTNNFTLEVSDNGTPGMSATQSFSVVVNPLSAPAVSNVSAAGGHFSFSISGQTGPDYAVETSTNLTQWSTVFLTNSPALPFVWTDTNSAEPQRFYRIKLGPPLP
ncbi:MAG TPA: cellulase family glycosylhydrolase [Verrucomicrobiae bacterium]|nr:cellulase family glycosylhydrolase [Verrucomicrobiae bacterium]